MLIVLSRILECQELSGTVKVYAVILRLVAKVKDSTDTSLRGSVQYLDPIPETFK
jgi:hypothetical protein